MTASHPALEVVGLGFVYPDGRVALRDVTLSVEPGERVAILGPNGAGKSTFVLHLNGVLGGGTGTVAVDGLDVVKANLREIRRRVGIVFQDPDDQLFMPTVERDVGFGPANLGGSSEATAERVQRALDAVGMAESAHRPPQHLSFGERRRVALATVLSMDPTLLVLDEPSANLDPLARRDVADIVRRLELTTLIVTHDLLYALELCSRAVILDAGSVVTDGPIRDVLADADLLHAHRLELPAGVTIQLD